MNKEEELKQEFINDYQPCQIVEFPVECGTNEVFNIKLNNLIQQYADEVSRESNKLLEIAQCPNCDGSGAIGRNVLDGNGDPDVDWEQCQWCYERELLLKEQEEQ